MIIPHPYLIGLSNLIKQIVPTVTGHIAEVSLMSARQNASVTALGQSQTGLWRTIKLYVLTVVDLIVATLLPFVKKLQNVNATVPKRYLIGLKEKMKLGFAPTVAEQDKAEQNFWRWPFQKICIMVCKQNLPNQVINRTENTSVQN